MLSSELMYRTDEGCTSLPGFELGSFAKQVVVVALLVVHSYGTSNMAWCLCPANVSTFPVDFDLKVIVYGCVVISATKSPDSILCVRECE
jgi:hypothetical protein